MASSCRPGSTSPRTSPSSPPGPRRGCRWTRWEFTVTTEIGRGVPLELAGSARPAQWRRRPSTCTASPSGPSSAPPGRACPSTPCSKTSRPPPTTRWCTPTAATPPTCRCEDLLDGQAWIVYRYDGDDLARRARRARAAAGPAPLPLEVREMGARHPAARPGRAGVLGDGRLPRLRRPMARTAVSRRLTWRVAQLTAAREETATARTLVLDVPGWPGHLAGQHVDVRLTAEDGYTAQRSYSLSVARGRRQGRADRPGRPRRRGLPLPHRGPLTRGPGRDPRPGRRLVRLAAHGPGSRAARRGRLGHRAAHGDGPRPPPGPIPYADPARLLRTHAAPTVTTPRSCGPAWTSPTSTPARRPPARRESPAG